MAKEKAKPKAKKKGSHFKLVQIMIHEDNFEEIEEHANRGATGEWCKEVILKELSRLRDKKKK